MNIWIVAYYTMLRSFRDVKTMLALIIIPIVLIFIIGTAIGSLDTLYTAQQIERAKVGFYSEDTGDIPEQLHQYLQSDKLQDLIELKNVTGYEEGFNQVKTGELEAFIYFPGTFTTHYTAGEKVSIQFYNNKEFSIVQPLIESFVITANTRETVTWLGAQFVPLTMENNITETKIITEGKIAKGIDYYSITTLFQSLLIGSVIGIFAIAKDSSNHTIRRMRSMPVKNYQLYIGKILGSTVTLFSSALVIFLFTKFVYQANWSGNIALILLVIFLFTLICISLGMFVTKLFKGTLIPILIMMLFMMVFTLTSGGFDPRVGPIREAIGKFTPNYYAQQGIFNSIYGEGAISIESSILVLTIYAVILIILTLIIRRRKWHEYFYNEFKKIIQK